MVLQINTVLYYSSTIYKKSVNNLILNEFYSNKIEERNIFMNIINLFVIISLTHLLLFSNLIKISYTYLGN